VAWRLADRYPFTLLDLALRAPDLYLSALGQVAVVYTRLLRTHVVANLVR
jgi:hypothetical protein